MFFAVIVWQFFLLTLDFQASGRTTQTIEMPLAPWWWVTTALMALGIPVQAWVFLPNLYCRSDGRALVVREQIASETYWRWQRLHRGGSMDPITTGLLGLAAMFLLIALQVPVGIAMGIVGVVGCGLIIGWGPAFRWSAPSRRRPYRARVLPSSPCSC